MRRCKIGNAGCYVLQNALESADCPIRSLILSYNDIGEHGAIALSRGLWRNRVVERVDLRGNRIGVAGAVALAHVVRSNLTLRYLDVSQNNMRIRGIQEIHIALQDRARRAGKRLATSRGNGAPKLRQVRRRRDSASPATGVPEDQTGSAAPERHSQTGVRSSRGGAGGRAGSASAEPASQRPGTAGISQDDHDDGDAEYEFEVDDDGGRVGEGGSNGSLPAEPLSEQWRQRAAGIGTPPGGGDDGEADQLHPFPSGAELMSQAVSGLLDPHLEWDLTQGKVGAEGIHVRWAGNLVNQEITHSIIHGVGLLLSIVGAVPLIQKAQAGSIAQLVSVLVYVAGLVTFYVMATLRHSLFFLESTSRTLRVLDHMCVYALIAGTYTPFLSVNLGHTWFGTIVLVSMWLAACVGILGAWWAGHRMNSFKTVMYLAMGWAGAVTTPSVIRCVDGPGVYLLLGGGVIYSLGFAFYSLGRTTPATSRWRWAWYLLAVIASTLHYCAVFWYVDHRPGCEDLPLWGPVTEASPNTSSAT